MKILNRCGQKAKKNNNMHPDDIENDPNLWDNEHPEWFMYDSELLNAWFWDELAKEIEEEE